MIQLFLDTDQQQSHDVSRLNAKGTKSLIEDSVHFFEIQDIKKSFFFTYCFLCRLNFVFGQYIITFFEMNFNGFFSVVSLFLIYLFGSQMAFFTYTPSWSNYFNSEKFRIVKNDEQDWIRKSISMRNESSALKIKSGSSDNDIESLKFTHCNLYYVWNLYNGSRMFFVKYFF